MVALAGAPAQRCAGDEAVEEEHSLKESTATTRTRDRVCVGCTSEPRGRVHSIAAGRDSTAGSKCVNSVPCWVENHAEHGALSPLHGSGRPCIQAR